MRTFGVLALLVGGFFLLRAVLMDTSVPTGMGERVHNIGLMRDQQNAIVIGIGLMVIGAILVAMGGGKSSAVETHADTSDARTCPYCAETIKAQAVVCRFCGKELPQPSAPASAVPALADRLTGMGHTLERASDGGWMVCYKSGGATKVPSEAALERLISDLEAARDYQG